MKGLPYTVGNICGIFPIWRKYGIRSNFSKTVLFSFSGKSTFENKFRTLQWIVILQDIFEFPHDFPTELHLMAYLRYLKQNIVLSIALH